MREHRQDADDGTGHDDVPLRRVLALQAGERDGQGLQLGRAQHDERPQEAVPAAHEREDRERGEGRADVRQDDRPEDPEVPGAVERGGLVQLDGTWFIAWRSRKMPNAAANVGSSAPR